MLSSQDTTRPVFFDTLTFAQVQEAIIAAAAANYSYDGPLAKSKSYYEQVKKIFVQLDFLMNVWRSDKQQLVVVDNIEKLAEIANLCLRILSSPIIAEKIDYLILNYTSMNKDKTISPIFKEYYYFLNQIYSRGGNKTTILNLALTHAAKIENIHPQDLKFMLLTIAQFSSSKENVESDDSDDDYVLIFQTFTEQAKTHPHSSISKFIAKANNLEIADNYIKLLEIFNSKNYDADKILRLFHYQDGKKQKTFYHSIKQADIEASGIVNKCDKLLAELIINKIKKYPLASPEEIYLLDHKEKITIYILNLPADQKAVAIRTILQERDTPLSQYFWTARFLTTPSVKSGELKKLKEHFSFSTSSAGERSPQQAHSIFSPRPQTADAKQEEQAASTSTQRFGDKTLHRV